MHFIQKVKRQKFYYYASHTIMYLTPRFLHQIGKNKYIDNSKLKDKGFHNRITYYIPPNCNAISVDKWIAIKNYKRPQKGSMYFFDLLKYLKFFNKNNTINYQFGDVTENFDQPTIVKSRPINHNGNAVLMKMNQLRHFHFINDTMNFRDKKDAIVWRGRIHKENRRLLVEKFHKHLLCNIGEVSTKNKYPKEWQKNKLSIKEQLNYKFILSIEGIDVATNLKWIMSSNSLCFMPTPKFETWFMEGKLKPNFHYVHIKDDYSDLIEKRNYYLKNEQESLKIIANANNWVKQFQNEKVEKSLSLHVLDQFFKQTNQYN